MQLRLGIDDNFGLANTTICERGFSKQIWANLSDRKNRLKLETWNASMRVSLCGLPMENMDWARIFDTWKSTKNRMKGCAFGVGWWLSALCRESKQFLCIILLHVFLQYSKTSYYFHIQYKTASIKFGVFNVECCKKCLKVWVKCDHSEALHIEMHVDTSNLEHWLRGLETAKFPHVNRWHHLSVAEGLKYDHCRCQDL